MGGPLGFQRRVQTSAMAELPESPRSEDVGGPGSKGQATPVPASQPPPGCWCPRTRSAWLWTRGSGQGERGRLGLAATAFYGRLWERQVSTEKAMTQG